MQFREKYLNESHFDYPPDKELEPLETIDIYELLKVIEASTGLSPEGLSIFHPFF